MSFKKYNSIENSYRQKHIMRSLDYFPEIKDCKYSIREKLDGANIQLYFEPGEELKVGKRSGFISKDDNFYDIWETLKKYQKEINAIQDEVDISNIAVRIYGELYGKGVQKRVNYGEEKYIAFFDVEVDGELWSQFAFERLMADLNITNLCPLLGYTENLQEALEFNENFDSKILNIENNPAEGFVIKPYLKDFNLGNGQRFILKKKSDNFSEKMKVGSSAKKVQESNRLIAAKTEFNLYINENRLQGIISKYGEIESMDDMGKYIKLLLDDAKEDFLKDYDITELSDKEVKLVTKSGGRNAAMLIRSHV